MDVNKQLALFICSYVCAEKKPKKRGKTRRIWARSWLERQHGLCSLQREFEMEDHEGFRNMFRMRMNDFNLLLEKVEPHLSRQDTRLRLAIPVKDRLAVTLRFLATGETYKSLSFQFRMGASTVSRIVAETCEALHLVLKEDYLKTPRTEAEWLDIAKGFEEKWQFPHCLGSLDGKHIYIQPPPHSGSTFRNYKCRFSVLLMAAVDANCNFIYVNVGTQGRVSDAGLFATSDLKRALDNDLLNIPPPAPLPNSDVQFPFVFVGDEAYPLRLDLMKPFPHRQLEMDQRVFNYRLSRARRVVENAFGILANRWRVFRSTIMLSPDKVTKLTMAAVCLHNFLGDCGSESPPPPELADRETAEGGFAAGEWRGQRSGALHPRREGIRNASHHAKQLRNVLKDYFMSTGYVPWQDKYA
ncbi:uncharacterized protein LOC125279578 [Megalobrama amblycephala]|uniref:uncharacterized protein LOC125264505 n=1 Tax=Megalobrama amblycephala TaxID=75352 RepID=UPI002013E3A0|nr:uncharacterized protein LOC125264505 [Megalobrama amblycephala]XP_048065382.1 uncharacterized protein LOC125279578 [Megalobrama amblycephala]